MNRMNLFNAFERKKENHEDVLTRNFMILVDNIPAVQDLFLNLVKKSLGKNNFLDTMELKVTNVDTQVSHTNVMFTEKNLIGSTIISVLISDDIVTKEDKIKIKHTDRSARYDGVIKYNDSVFFIIENKPNICDVWDEQLCPNIPENELINLIEQPALISWGDIILKINDLIANHNFIEIEMKMLYDFLEYIDSTFINLNPYQKFSICKNSTVLFDKRCISILAQMNSKINYHKGWKYNIATGLDTVKKIALSSEIIDADLNVSMWMYAADTMNAAKKLYNNIDIDDIRNMEEIGFVISSNFHVSFSSSNLIYFDNDKDILEYFDFWKSNQKLLKQIKKENNGFKIFFKIMQENNLISKIKMQEVITKVYDKNYKTLNICPGILFKYTWAKDTVIELDDKDRFYEDFESKVKLIINLLDF